MFCLKRLFLGPPKCKEVEKRVSDGRATSTVIGRAQVANHCPARRTAPARRVRAAPVAAAAPATDATYLGARDGVD